MERQQPEPEPDPEPQPAEQQPAQRPAVHGRLATLCDLRRDGYMPTYIEGAAYDTVTLGADAKDVERNSVLLIPDLLSAAECAQLIDDVDHHELGPADLAFAQLIGGGGFERHSLTHLSTSSSVLFDKVLRERLLPFVSAELPAVEDHLWVRSTREAVHAGQNLFAPTQARATGTPLGELSCRFTPKEPAINRYSDGAEFAEHTDQQGLTINILLRAGAFVGGGTAFWEEGTTSRQGCRFGCSTSNRRCRSCAALLLGDPPTLCLQSAAGVGVLFNGTVKHAGRPTTTGVRHLLVASFCITNDRDADPRMMGIRSEDVQQ